MFYNVWCFSEYVITFYMLLCRYDIPVLFVCTLGICLAIFLFLLVSFLM